MSLQERRLSDKITVSILVILLMGGVYLRFFNLGKPSFWVDELNHVYAGMALSEGENPTFPSGVANGRSLIYSKLVGWSFSLFGVSEFSARFGSAILGLFSILLIYIVGRDLFSRRVGLIAAFFLTFAHPAIGWSRTSRMYTLFQFLFLLAVFLFHKGVEANKAFKNVPEEKTGVLAKLNIYLQNRGLQWPWLLLSGLVFIISLKVHLLTGLFAATLLVYCAVCFFGQSFDEGFAESLSSKYAVCGAAMAGAILIGLVAFNLSAFVQYALDFHPDWARNIRMEDSHYYFWFLTAGDQFPLAALFLLGAIQAFIRLNKNAIFCVLAFIVPLFFHSFVFSYKVSNYVFNIYPFFLLIIAYGLSNFYETELLGLISRLRDRGIIKRKLSPQSVRFAITAMFVLLIPMTVWFRIAIKIPNIDSAGNNGAITHYDWRGAAQVVSQNEMPGDAVISTLPLTVLYYLGKVDYNLNMAHLDQSLKWETSSTNGRNHEFYTNVPSVKSIDELQEIMAKHAKGWLIADLYRLNREQYVSPELSHFIQTHLSETWSDEKRTMVVYRWSG